MLFFMLTQMVNCVNSMLTLYCIFIWHRCFFWKTRSTMIIVVNNDWVHNINDQMFWFLVPCPMRINNDGRSNRSLQLVIINVRRRCLRYRSSSIKNYECVRLYFSRKKLKCSQIKLSAINVDRLYSFGHTYLAPLTCYGIGFSFDHYSKRNQAYNFHVLKLNIFKTVVDQSFKSLMWFWPKR